MADTTEQGLKNVTDELVKSNKKLDTIDETLAKPSGPTPAEIKQAKEDAKNAANKNNSWLAKIAGNIGNIAGDKAGKGAKNLAGKGMKGMLAGLLPSGMAAKLGGAGIIAKLGVGGIVLAGVLAAVTAVGDGLKTMDWAKSMGMEKESGFIAGLLGGNVKGGLMNAFKQSMKGAAMGATIGMVGGPVGMIIGALVGAALFGIAGWFGAGALAKMIDPLVQDARRLFGLTVNVTPKELEEAKKVAATTLKLKTDAISNTEKLTEQLTKARAATEPDQKLIDSLVIQVAASMKASVEAHKNHEKAATKSLLLDRAAESNALIIAEDAVKANKAELLHLTKQRRIFERAVSRYDKDSLEGQLAATNLAAVRVKLKNTRDEGLKLREAEEKAEAVLLEEDRRLIKKAKDEGGEAPWRARINVMTSDAFKSLKDKWNRLTTFIPTWFANNIFDPGQAGGASADDAGSPMKIFGVAIPSMGDQMKVMREKWSALKTSVISWFVNNIFDPGSGPVGIGDSGSPMKIFGVAIPSMGEAKKALKSKWSNLKVSAISWFADNIFDSGTPMRIFGVAMPSMKEIKEGIQVKWNTLKTSVGTWFADNIFDSGTPMKIFGVAMPSMKEIKEGIQVKWNTLKTSAITWFADNIFDSGGEGKPMKIFGAELSLPDIKIPTGAEILAILPDWMTDPVGALKRLITSLTKYLPSWLGGAKKSEADVLAERIAKLEAKRVQSITAWEDWASKKRNKESYSKEQLDIEQSKFKSAKRHRETGKELETLRAMQATMQAKMVPKAVGGPVMAGQPYLIGERGPEQFVPKQSGTVIPNHALGGGATVINAPTTSNVTTTGNSGQFPLQNNKYANLNRAYA